MVDSRVHNGDAVKKNKQRMTSRSLNVVKDTVQLGTV